MDSTSIPLYVFVPYLAIFVQVVMMTFVFIAIEFHRPEMPLDNKIYTLFFWPVFVKAIIQAFLEGDDKD